VILIPARGVDVRLILCYLVSKGAILQTKCPYCLS